MKAGTMERAERQDGNIVKYPQSKPKLAPSIRESEKKWKKL
jgi:hypothetical protein